MELATAARKEATAVASRLYFVVAPSPVHVGAAVADVHVPPNAAAVEPVTTTKLFEESVTLLPDRYVHAAAAASVAVRAVDRSRKRLLTRPPLMLSAGLP